MIIMFKILSLSIGFIFISVLLIFGMFRLWSVGKEENKILKNSKDWKKQFYKQSGIHKSYRVRE